MKSKYESCGCSKNFGQKMLEFTNVVNEDGVGAKLSGYVALEDYLAIALLR